MAVASQFQPVDAKIAGILQGVNKAWVDVYKPILRDADIQLTGFMNLGGGTATGRFERLAYPEAPPSPSRWDYGTDIPRGTFRYRMWVVQVFRYAKALDWEADDAADDQLNALEGQAAEMASRFGLLPMRVMAQILSGGTADPDLLPANPNAADGVGLFSQTDVESNNRFGQSGGNIITPGSGVGNEAAYERDLWRVIQRARILKDTAGRRRWPGPLIERGVVICASADNEEVIRKAFIRDPLTVATVAGTTTAAAVTPVSTRFVKRVEILADLSGNDWFAALLGAPRPAMFRLALEEAAVYFGNKGNSDRARDNDLNSFYAKGRWAFGCGVCDQTFKVSNS